MWEMQVLSSQRNSGKTDDATGAAVPHAEGGEDRLNGGGVEGAERPNSATADSHSSRDDDEHPALRGIQTATVAQESTLGLNCFDSSSVVDALVCS
ncbi:hypothetical protein JTB14_022868 [Gonioctena quinquepunctata]|nr:hypothetical protein JTB14_022868 [Gonioctena quinquepunctata]